MKKLLLVLLLIYSSAYANMPGTSQPMQVGGQTGNDSFTKILLHMDGANAGTTFVDNNAGGSAHTWTASSATTSTVSFEFPTASMLGATGGISTPDSADFTLGSGNWTVDFWINRNGNTGTMGLFGQANSGLTSSSIAAGFGAGNQLTLSYNNASTFTSTGTITGSAWHHVALVQNAGTLKWYVDGVADVTTAAYTTTQDLASSWWVGARGDFSGAKYAGYIDEFRLSVGIARWTANFTPPNAPYGP